MATVLSIENGWYVYVTDAQSCNTTPEIEAHWITAYVSKKGNRVIIKTLKKNAFLEDILSSKYTVIVG